MRGGAQDEGQMRFTISLRIREKKIKIGCAPRAPEGWRVAKVPARSSVNYFV